MMAAALEHDVSARVVTFKSSRIQCESASMK